MTRSAARAPGPARTTAFRLARRFALVFAAASVVLFSVVYWLAASFFAGQIDGTVRDEVAEIRADAASPGSRGIAVVVDGLARASPGTAYLLQDPAGRPLAGNMGPIRAVPGIRTLRSGHATRSGRDTGGLRGRGIVLPSGDYLFVGIDDAGFRAMRKAIAGAFAVSLLTVFLLAAGAGILAGRSVLGRIEAMSRTSREIMGGALTRRIATTGSGDELDHLAGSLNAMLDRIQALMSNLQQVSSDIAHDLRTPLARLRQRLERARTEAADPDAMRTAIDASIADVDAILGVFSALLRIAQISSGSRRAAFRPVDVSALLEDLVEIFAPVAAEQGQDLRADVEPALALTGDRDLLYQAVVNLIENAIRHCPAGTAIVVGGRREDGGGIVADVADDGPGLPPADRVRVLDRFVRLDASRTTSGSGLGLWLVSAIATLHNASLTLDDNRPGLRCRIGFPPAP